MDASNSPEQPNRESNQSRLAEQVAQEIISKMRSIDTSDSTPQEKAQQKSAVVSNVLNDYRQAQKALENFKETTRSGEVTEQQRKDIQKEQQNLRQALIKVSTLADNDVQVIENAKTQRILKELAKMPPTDSEAVAIQDALGDYLLGEGAKDIVLSKPGEIKSDFMKRVDNLISENPEAAKKIIYALTNGATDFGITPTDMLKNFGPPEQESQNASAQEQQRQQIRAESRFGGEDNYYSNRFTDEQLDLIATFYSPEKFVDYMEKLRDGDDGPEGVRLKHTSTDVQKRKEKIEEHIKDYYTSKNEPLPEEKLKQEMEKHWGEEVSEMMNWRVSDVINQLFLELQQKSPHKFYEEIMQEDIFQGPAMIQKRIQTAINSLMIKVDQIKKDDPLFERMNKLQLYRHAAESYIDERDGKTYPRLHPLPFGEKIPTLSEFIQHINATINHTIHKAEYFHNSRAIYGHPAGEKGFYAQLGGFAETLHGTDIDEIMLLPDGQYIMQAYQLYDKMLEEDLASLDWRHRPDQMTNELDRVNSKIEQQVFAQLKAFYPDLTRERVRNIVNSAVGIGRGMFLTEAEKLAYTDPVDADGNGMVASYSTNDAASLNVFNPLQTSLRWQGEHNWNMMYFMPVEGQPGKMWDHKKAWDNMAKYMDSFLVGRGQGKGKDKLSKVFADEMMDINNVGGPNKRKGWRMSYSLDGHYIFEKDTQGNNTKDLDVLQTFKAMEAIGFEALYNFTNTLVPDKAMGLLKNTSGPLKDQRNEWFKYIYERYFDQKKPLSQYLDELRRTGENKALEEQTKNGSNNSWEEQIQLETSKLFMGNFIAHYVAERFPTKFLRIDRNRFSENGVSRWEQVYREFHEEKKWDREKFDLVMKDMTMAEMLFKREISKQIRTEISFDKKLTLDQIDSLPYRLDEVRIRELLSKNKNGEIFKSEKEINDVVALWKHIKKDFINNEFLDTEGANKIRDYTFTFGLEDTDISLIAYRGTGPRMIARLMKDIGSVESTITPWITQMPRILNEIALSGKHDFSPIIEYLRKAQNAIFDIHGTEEAQKFTYNIAGTVINYFKKDTMAKLFFGLFRLGKRNSIAAEYAGRSTAVWEWDSRDIDRFCVALESYRLLPLNAYDLNKTERGKLVDGKFKNGRFSGGDMEDRWIKWPGLKPFKFGKKRHIDWKWNAAKLRKDHGADWKAITWDYINQFLPIAAAFLLWKYIKDAMDEA